jgi:tRNA(Arg) A34 adenosine deaminase TadA
VTLYCQSTSNSKTNKQHGRPMNAIWEGVGRGLGCRGLTPLNGPPMLSRNERRFLNLVSHASVGSQHPRWKVAAVLVRSGTPVATAVNRARNSPAQVPVADVGYHAEHRAMRSAPGRCRGATMFVGRVRRDGSPGLAKPCAACVAAMALAGISTVVWTTETGYDTARISTLI